MSKKKGPFLITDLASKLGSAPTPTRSTKPAEDTDHARNAYGFIAENYKNVPNKPETMASTTESAHVKSGSNRVQIEFKSGSNQVQKPVQTGFKSGSEKSASKSTLTKSGSESGSTLVQTGFKSGSNQVQIEAPPAPTTDVLMARGDQRRVLDFFFDLSVTAGDRSTPSLSSAEIGKALQMPQESVRTALKRLLQRGAILRRGFQRGRSGWSSYELSQTAYRELLDFRKSGSNWVQTGFKSGSKSGSESGSTASSSSSSIEIEKFKTTTTGESELFDDSRIQLSPEWSAVDISPLAEISFTQTHLMQLAKYSKLSAAEVESSIAFFAFDLRRNGKAKMLNGSPLNFFMGILRKGIPYAPPENYESPADEARRLTREMLERKARERQIEEQRIRDLEFTEWRRGLAADELMKLLPEFARKPGQIQDSALRSHFDEKVWPKREVARLAISNTERVETCDVIAQSLFEGVEEKV